jgi:type IV secretory pathway component VirB8
MILFAQSETYRILFSYQLFLGKTHIDELKILSICTEDTSETGQVVTNYWKAVIGYKFNRQKIRVDDIIQNPLGIEIIDYEIIKRNIMK